MKTKKRRFYRAAWLLTLMTLMTNHAHAQIKVVDKDDNMAISYASMIRSADIPPFNPYVQTAMKSMTEPKDE